MNPRVVPAMVARPARPLGALQFLRAATSNTLGICDDQVFEELVVQRRYGPFRVAFVSDPEGVKQILVNEPDNYPRLPAIRRLYANEIGTGTLASDGETWRSHRRVAAAVIDRRAFAADLPELIRLAEEAAEGWGTRFGAAPFDIEAEVSALAGVLLNHGLTGGDPRGIPILSWLSKVPRKPRFLDVMPMPAALRPLISPGRQAEQRIRLSEQLKAMIEQRSAPDYAGSRDLLWRVAHAVDRKDGARLPLTELRDEAASIGAGGDASTRALTWIWYLLALRPDVEARLHEEVDALLGNGPIRPEHLAEAPYARRVLNEVMRLYPPIPALARQSRRTEEVCGQRIVRGTYVFVMPWVIHRHRRLWDDPDAFEPDRFEEAQVRERPRYAFIPFSAGVRVCSGASYAVAQITMILLALARRYRFRPMPGAAVQPFGAITLKPRGGLRVTLERR